MSLQAFLEGGFGLRGTSRMVKMTGSFLQKALDGVVIAGKKMLAKAPSYNTVKNWSLQLGCYKLNREKSKGDDWAILLDKTIQMGPDKCLTIVGVRLSNLNKENLTLSQKDLEPLVVKITKTCPGEVVLEGLLEARRKIGGYCQILSDGGSDLVRGIRLFDSMSTHFYDVTHKLALLIKTTFGRDSNWSELVKQATAMTQKIKQSSIAHLAPPELRAKSSTLNLGGFVHWACRLWTFVKNQERWLLKDKDLIQQHCGWINHYEEFLKTGLQIVEIADVTKALVHRHGYGQSTEKKFENIGKSIHLEKNAKLFLNDLECFIKGECKKVPVGQVRLGTTDILESVFGKFKKYEAQFSEEGFTTLAGILPTLVGDLREQDIKKALSTYSALEAKGQCGNVCSQNTYLARRRKDLSKIDESFNTNFYLFREEVLRVVGL